MEIESKFLDQLARARRVCVLTGAGISAESGVPTFRGGGQSAVWKGMPFDEISSARMVRENLGEVWEWFDYRLGILKDCRPNAGHFALAEIAQRFSDFTLVTQNIDGFHCEAGSRDVIELHGNIQRARCVDCEKRFEIAGIVPHWPEECDECGAKLRPDVVLFGEMLPEGAFEIAVEAARRCDLFLVVGTSALVYPAAGLAAIARSAGAVVVEINPEETALSDVCDFAIREKSGVALPMLASVLNVE